MKNQKKTLTEEPRWICKVSRLCERYGKSHIIKKSKFPSVAIAGRTCRPTALCGSPLDSFNYTHHLEVPKGTEACKRCLAILKIREDTK